jgi:hypothetical protein
VSEPKKRRRRCTPVVVRPPKTAPITPEDYELAVYAIAAMIARWWDANGHQMPDTENSNRIAPEPTTYRRLS